MMKLQSNISKESTPNGALSIRGVSNSAGSVSVSMKRIFTALNCTKCKKPKDLLTSVWCKECRKKYLLENQDRVITYRRQYAIDNKEEIAIRIKKFRINNDAHFKSQSKKYRNAPGYREKRNIQDRERKKRDPMYRIRVNLHVRLWFFLRALKKSTRTMELVGCDLEFLKKHLESQFDEKMTWDNYGTYWHIDHLRPCKSFNLLDPEQQKKCFHWTNLQPLEGKENMSKGAKLIKKHIEKLIKNQAKYKNNT